MSAVVTAIAVALAGGWLFIQSTGSLVMPASASGNSEARIKVFVGWVLASDIALGDGVTLTFSCTPGNGNGGGGDDHHANGGGGGNIHSNGDNHSNGEGEGTGDKKDQRCPAKINVTVTARGIGGVPLATVSRTGVGVPGSAFFNFVPDVAIALVQSTTVTVSKP